MHTLTEELSSLALKWEKDAKDADAAAEWNVKLRDEAARQGARQAESLTDTQRPTATARAVEQTTASYDAKVAKLKDAAARHRARAAEARKGYLTLSADDRRDAGLMASVQKIAAEASRAGRLVDAGAGFGTRDQGAPAAGVTPPGLNAAAGKI